MMTEQSDNMVVNCFTWAVNNFGMTMFLMAVVFIILHRILKRDVKEAEIVYRWVALFGLGFTGIYAFIMHIVYPTFTADVMGLPTSLFQVQVGMADFAFGILGILSFRSGYSFRLATVVGSTIWLWGSSGWHTWYLLKLNNYSFSNAGSWPWLDLIVPMVLVFCAMRMQRD